VNGLAVLRLKKGHSHNEKIVSLHLLEDVLGWVAVLIGAIIIYYTGWTKIDPILSLLISCFILFNVYRGIKSSMRIILQGIPKDLDLEKVHKSLVDNNYVVSIHDLHIWSLDGEENIMTVHLVTTKELSQVERLEIKGNVQKEMDHLGIGHCTLEFEIEGEDCGLEDC
jgi:cobalt-zinc-cadmium efflux system protein